MELVPGSRARDQNKLKHVHGGRMGLDSETLLVIKLPDSMVLRVICRSVFLALVFITLPCIGSVMRVLTDPTSDPESGIFNYEQLDLLLQDLADEGLLRKTDKSLIVCSGLPSMIHKLKKFDADQIDKVMDSALEGQSSFIDNSFDFVYASNLAVDVEFVDRVVKIGGIVAFPLSNEQANTLREKTNYKIVYLRRYSSTIVAMRKTSSVEALVEKNSSTKRRLFQSEAETKKAAALEGLEEVLLEPPRRQHSKNWRSYSGKIKFLPHLLEDSLEGFRRRVFVNVGLPEEHRDVTQWFRANYPKMEQEFEIYDLDLVHEAEEATPENGNDISDWLKKNVGKEDYVVMKAEAEVVEEMMNRKTIHKVDELFLECNNQWWNKNNKSKRAYWECLALYGRVKDEGVAVHQWWG